MLIARKFLLIFLFLLLAVTFSYSCLNGQTMQQGPKKTSTSDLKFLSDFNPPSGIYYYDIFLGTIRLGKVTIKTEKKDDYYSIEVKGNTRKAFSSLYKVRYRGEAMISDTPVKPLSATIAQQSGEKRRDVAIAYPSENMIAVTEQKSETGKESRTEEYILESSTFILDPFTTFFLVRALDWQPGMTEMFDVFSGKKHYELQLTCTGETTTEYDGKQREAWVIVPQANTPGKPDKQKLADYEILLSRDEKRKILTISGSSNIGRIVARMRKFKPLPP